MRGLSPPHFSKWRDSSPLPPYFSTHDAKFAPILEIRTQPSHAIESAYIIVNQPVDHIMAVILAIQAMPPFLPCRSLCAPSCMY